MTEQVVDGTAEETAEDFKPSASELEVRPDRGDDVFRAMDAADEVQILSALEGRPSDKMVYRFESGGQQQVGLSYQGVAEVVRTMNSEGHTAIRVSPEFEPRVEEIQEEDENGQTVTYIQVTVYAEDAKNGGGNFGTARQPKFQTFRNRQRKPQLDKYALPKAYSKAQRNAMLPLTPVIFREALIAKLQKNQTRVQELHLGMGDPTAELPPPLTDERAEKLKERIRAVYAEIRALAPLKVPPGEFNARLSRAEHEHERMEELLASFEGLRDHLKEKAA